MWRAKIAGVAKLTRYRERALPGQWSSRVTVSEVNTGGVAYSGRKGDRLVLRNLGWKRFRLNYSYQFPIETCVPSYLEWRGDFWRGYLVARR